MGHKNVCTGAGGEFDSLETIILGLFVDPLRTPFGLLNDAIGLALLPSRSQFFEVLVELRMYRVATNTQLGTRRQDKGDRKS